MRRTIVFATVLAMAAVGATREKLYAGEDDATVTVEDVACALDDYVSSIRDIEVVFEEEAESFLTLEEIRRRWGRPDLEVTDLSPKEISTVHFCRAGNKVYCYMEVSREGSETVRVYEDSHDLVEHRSLYSERHGIPVLRGMISRDTGFSGPQPWYETFLYFDPYGNAKFTHANTIRGSDSRILSLSEPLGDFTCVVLEAIEAPNRATVSQFWLEPKKNFLPVRIDYLRDGVLKARWETTSFQQVKAGLFIPKTCVCEHYVTEPTVPDLRGRLAHRVSITVTEAKVNAGISEELFTVHFPQGTMVIDEIRDDFWFEGFPDYESFVRSRLKQTAAAVNKLIERPSSSGTPGSGP
jgi:hypothetical protein